MGRYFNLAEMCQSDTARARGIDNTPPPAVKVKLETLVQRLLDAVMAVDGVVTCKLGSLLRHSSQTDGWIPVDTHATLDAGYFEFADEEVEGNQCVLHVVSVNDLIKSV